MSNKANRLVIYLGGEIFSIDDMELIARIFWESVNYQDERDRQNSLEKLALYFRGNWMAHIPMNTSSNLTSSEGNAEPTWDFFFPGRENKLWAPEGGDSIFLT